MASGARSGGRRRSPILTGAASFFRNWRGKSGKAPESAVIVDDPGGDPAHGKVLATMGCGSAGDAFSVNTMDCSLEAPCLVEYDTKGRAWQGFSDAYPGNHIWTATPSDYEGQQVRTVHDTEVRLATFPYWRKSEDRAKLSTFVPAGLAPRRVPLPRGQRTARARREHRNHDGALQ